MYTGLPKSNRDAHTAAAEIESGSRTPQTCSGARRARVPAGGCVPERATPGAPGRSGVPAQPPDAACFPRSPPPVLLAIL